VEGDEGVEVGNGVGSGVSGLMDSGFAEDELYRTDRNAWFL
jgi:hypothetical protein